MAHLKKKIKLAPQIKWLKTLKVSVKVIILLLIEYLCGYYDLNDPNQSKWRSAKQ